MPAPDLFNFVQMSRRRTEESRFFNHLYTTSSRGTVPKPRVTRIHPVIYTITTIYPKLALNRTQHEISFYTTERSPSAVNYCGGAYLSDQVPGHKIVCPDPANASPRCSAQHGNNVPQIATAKNVSPHPDNEFHASK